VHKVPLRTRMVLWTLFKAGLLVANGVAILHEDRFLRGLDLHVVDQAAADQGQLKAQVAGLLNAVRYLRLPLVALDVFAVLMIIFFG
jgi:immediate early response 3-interacting protein 1